MSYTRSIPIEFNWCDPAGIVFYARYFEMTNSVCETFFADRIGRSYARIMADGCGIPTGRLTAEFRAPSRLGDRLEVTLAVARIGGASLDVTLTARCAGALRAVFTKTLVWIGPEGRPAPWPEDMRARLQAEMEDEA